MKELSPNLYKKEEKTREKLRKLHMVCWTCICIWFAGTPVLHRVDCEDYGSLGGLIGLAEVCLGISIDIGIN